MALYRRTRLTLIVILLLLVLVAFAVLLRKQAPPEAARLLPESDGIVYFDLRPLRLATRFDRHLLPAEGDYRKFLDATGFVFERDLDEAAFALHRMADPEGPNGPVAFSEIFVGRFDGRRVTRFLASQAASTESYAGHVIYSIPNQGRTVRVALISYDTIAVSNTPTAEQIHSILDRYRTAAMPFTGSTLLSRYYSQVPLLSVAWGIGQVGLPLSENGSSMSILGLRLPVPADTTFLMSARATTALRLRIEEIAPSEREAESLGNTALALVGLLRNAQLAPGTAEAADVAGVLDSVRIEHRRNHAVLTATLPYAFVEKILTPAPTPPALPAPPAGAAAGPPAAPAGPSPAGRGHRRH